MGALFLFGTLLDDRLRALVAGEDTSGRAASLPGHRVVRAAAGDYPVLVAAPDAMVEGLLLSGLSDAQLARFDFYEAGFGYALSETEVLCDGQHVAARVYRPVTPESASGAPWSLTEWEAGWGPMTRHAAIEVMSYFGQIDGTNLRFRMPTIRVRAASAIHAAANPMPVARRAPFGREDVTLKAHRRPYSHFFTLDELDLTHPHFDGTISTTISRAVMIMGDAVTVLPYDPARDTVMIVEQFRAGPYARGDLYPWSLEPIAGRIDPGESAEDAARREAVEEAGLTLNELIPIASCYPSPGAISEYLYLYAALADLPDSAAGLGGEEHEGEDIRSHVLTLDALMELVASGEVDNGPLLTSALWLERERGRGRFA